MSSLPLRMPVQPVVTDSLGVLRFVGNPIVQRLYDSLSIKMRTDVLCWDDSDEVRWQFAQLLGRSVREIRCYGLAHAEALVADLLDPGQTELKTESPRNPTIEETAEMVGKMAAAQFLASAAAEMRVPDGEKAGRPSNRSDGEA